MKHGKILVVLAVAPFVAAVAAGQDKATPQQVVAKVRQAASTLSKTGDLAPTCCGVEIGRAHV